MLRARHQTDPNAAIKYRTNAKAAQEGYYTEDQEMAGWWRGKGAALLGLKGVVQAEEFRRLCFNLHPDTGQPLTPRTKANRRVGTDFTFDAPKSVSIVYEYFRDERILKAVLRAVRETMEEMERDTATRVRKGGRDEDRKTGVLCWDELPHFTARPVSGVPDPQLHCHCFAFNATFDEAEGCWKAAQLGELWKNLPHYETAFHARLSKSLRDLGYEIEKHGKYFEIAGITRSLIEKFSNRTKTILAKARELGMTDPKAMDGLGALTREKKAKEITRTELRAVWWERLTPEDKQAFEAIRTRLMRNPQMAAMAKMSPEQVWQFLGRADAPKLPVLANQSKIDQRAAAFALEHVFERASVVSEQELVTEALQWGYGEATIEGVRAAVKQIPLLRVEKDGETYLTTSEVLAEEKRIIMESRNGKGKFPPFRAFWHIHDERLNQQQQEAVLSVLHSEDFITGISGKAGTGKTTLLHEAKKGIEDGGQRLYFRPHGGSGAGRSSSRGF
jgi:conjugative relaxase-like TrwC/TraI family protein